MQEYRKGFARALRRAKPFQPTDKSAMFLRLQNDVERLRDEIALREEQQRVSHRDGEHAVPFGEQFFQHPAVIPDRPLARIDILKRQDDRIEIRIYPKDDEVKKRGDQKQEREPRSPAFQAVFDPQRVFSFFAKQFHSKIRPLVYT